jgi:hypothetical protein
MNDNNMSSMAREDLLARVKEGMEVYDSDGDAIGKVDGVYLGAIEDGLAADGGPAPAEAGLPYVPSVDIDEFTSLFLVKSDVPKEIHERLRYQGFVRIAPHGLFRTHRYALRDQVVSVAGDRVNLSSPESKLIKG